jgi:type II secretory pathway component GspD/PulD (secretin)
MRAKNAAALMLSLAMVAPGTSVGQELPPEALAGAQVGEAQGNQVYVSIVAVDRDLRSVAREIERKAGVNVYVDPAIEEVVNVRLINLPWRQVLEIVARDAQVEIEERGPRLFVLTQPPRVSMEFADADVRVVLDLLARQAGRNIVMASDVAGTVSLNLRNVHWWRALETIVKTAGFVAVRDTDDIIRIVRPDALRAQLETKVYPLVYLRPPDDYKAIISDRAGDNESTAGFFVANTTAPKGIEDFTLFRALSTMVNDELGENVQYNRESNSFVIHATATTHQEIEALLRKIDIEPQQVFVDIKFITTSNKNFWRDGLKLGDPLRNPGDAGFKAGLLLSGLVPTTVQNPIPVAGSTLGQFPFAFGEGLDAFGSAFQVPAILDFSQMDVLWQYVDIDQATKVTQAPTLLSLNDHPAVIFVGERVPFAEQDATQDQNGNVQVTLQEADSSPQDVGFTLFITPHIVRDTDQIILTVIPRVTRLTGNQANGLERFEFADPRNPGLTTFIDLPRVADQTVVTNLLVRDRNTAVIGGLMQESIFEVEERIPFLSDIPLLGKLFSYDSKDYSQENLIIFITPRIVRTKEDASDVFSRQYQIHQANDFYYHKYLKGSSGEDEPQGSKTPEADGAQAGEPMGAEDGAVDESDAGGAGAEGEAPAGDASGESMDATEPEAEGEDGGPMGARTTPVGEPQPSEGQARSHIHGSENADQCRRT